MLARSRTLLAAALVASACGSQRTPEFAYLRTDAVKVDVAVSAEAAEVRPGDWLPLHATRTTTGEWRKVPFREVPEGAAWLGYVPPAREEEVAANLRWYVEPADGVVFDAWAPRPVPIEQRAVKFASPGLYQVWATSHAPLDATSNRLQVRVLPP
jgi:hypothetical protein